MIWLTRFSPPRVSALLCVFALLTASALAKPGVKMDITVKGDYLQVDATTTSARIEPNERASRSPKFLEVSFPGTTLQSGEGTRAVDKGLVQRIQTVQGEDASLVRVYFLSQPQAKLTKTETGYRYVVHLNKMASPAAAASKTSTATPSSDKANSQAASTPPRSKVKVLTNRNQPTPQEETGQVKVLTNRGERDTQAAPPKNDSPRTVAAAPPQTSVGGTKPVTVVFQNTPLPEALRTLASKAGLNARVDSGLSGVVNLSFSDIPFHEALKLLVEPYGDNVKTQVADNTLIVTKAGATVGKPPSGNGETTFEYFPFEDRDAQKMLEAVQKAVPELTYQVDPELNVLLVEGSAADIERLTLMLRSVSKK